MKLSADALIAPEKISGYLLRWRPEDDKSAFLARAGYTAEHAEQLRRDLRSQLLPLDAEFLEPTEYGPKYLIRGSLHGPYGVELPVVTIWMTESLTCTFPSQHQRCDHKPAQGNALGSRGEACQP